VEKELPLSSAGTDVRLRFPKRNRILRRKTFLRIQRYGYRLDLGPVIACVLPAEHPHTRVGFTTSKRVGGAVFRNRCRRLMRDAVRRLLLLDNPLYDIVLIAKNKLSPELCQDDLDKAILQLRELLDRKASSIQNKAKRSKTSSKRQTQRGE